MEYHEKIHEDRFIPDNYLSLLYLQRGFIKKCEKETKTDTAIIPKPSVPFVPGKKLFIGLKTKSLLTKRQQAQCLAALKCLRSGKEPGKFTKQEKINIEVYKVKNMF